MAKAPFDVDVFKRELTAELVQIIAETRGGGRRGIAGNGKDGESETQ